MRKRRKIDGSICHRSQGLLPPALCLFLCVCETAPHRLKKRHATSLVEAIFLFPVFFSRDAQVTVSRQTLAAAPSGDFASKISGGRLGARIL